MATYFGNLHIHFYVKNRDFINQIVDISADSLSQIVMNGI